MQTIPAKPIIDIAVAVDDFSKFEALVGDQREEIDNIMRPQ